MSVRLKVRRPTRSALSMAKQLFHVTQTVAALERAVNRLQMQMADVAKASRGRMR